MIAPLHLWWERKIQMRAEDIDDTDPPSTHEVSDSPLESEAILKLTLGELMEMAGDPKGRADLKTALEELEFYIRCIRAALPRDEPT